MLNATQLTGLLSFGCAGLACTLAAWRTRRFAWACIGALHLLFAFEVVAGVRHALLAAAVEWMQSNGTYAGRQPIQRWMLGALLAALIAAVCVVAALLRRSGLRVCAAGVLTAVSLAAFVAEAISLHVLDAQFYSAAGPVLLIGWWWLASSSFVVWCAVTS